MILKNILHQGQIWLLQKKTPGKTKEVKDTDRELRPRDKYKEVALFAQEQSDASSSPQNAESQISHSQQANSNHDNPDTEQEKQETIIPPLQMAKQTATAATQTSDDIILKQMNEMALKLNKVDNELNHPRNGVLIQLAKTSAKAQGLYDKIHGAVDGLEIRMQKATQNIQVIQIKFNKWRPIMLEWPICWGRQNA